MMDRYLDIFFTAVFYGTKVVCEVEMFLTISKSFKSEWKELTGWISSLSSLTEVEKSVKYFWKTSFNVSSRRGAQSKEAIK